LVARHEPLQLCDDATRQCGRSGRAAPSQPITQAIGLGARRAGLSRTKLCQLPFDEQVGECPDPAGLPDEWNIGRRLRHLLQLDVDAASMCACDSSRGARPHGRCLLLGTAALVATTCTVLKTP